jgi:hypothetical protein
MNFAKPLGSARIDKIEAGTNGNIRELRDDVAFHQAASNESEMTPSDLSSLLDRVAGTSAREIDNLIGELQFLRKKLQTDGKSCRILRVPVGRHDCGSAEWAQSRADPGPTGVSF